MIGTICRYGIGVVLGTASVETFKGRIMRSIIKSSFLWQFSGGFVLGALGLIALQPAAETQALRAHVASVAHAR